MKTDLENDVNVLDEISKEMQSQVRRWGIQSHPHWTRTYGIVGEPLKSTDSLKSQCSYKGMGVDGYPPLSWTDILLEEVGEARDEARSKNLMLLRKELIQVAAVAASWIEAIDRGMQEDTQ
jgi:hypothetical protein